QEEPVGLAAAIPGTARGAGRRAAGSGRAGRGGLLGRGGPAPPVLPPSPSETYRKVLVWSGRFKKEDEIPEAITFEMLDAAKNKFRVKISYAMMALTVMGCVLMIIKGKQAARRHESLTSMNLEKKARLREEAAALQDHK
uniref:Protein FAM162A n=1 Tax=Ornithorhynchus anatinus TaxID=9258 RepID=A0A6I8NQF3_ORNAN